MVPVFLLATLSHTPYPPHAPSLRLGLSLGFPSPTLYPRPSELGPRVERKGTEGTRREHQRTERRRVESGIMVDLSQAFPILVSWPVLYLPLHTSRPFLIPLVTLGSLLSPRYLIPRHFSIPSHSPSSRFRPEGAAEPARRGEWDGDGWRMEWGAAEPRVSMSVGVSRLPPSLATGSAYGKD